MIRQFFSYYGSKKRAAKYYPPPDYDLIIEPFAGAAGYSHLYHTKKVLLLDTNPDVVCAWQFLIKASRDDVLSIPLLEPGQRLSELDIPEDARAFVGFWLIRASATSRDRMSSWAKRYPDRFWGEKVRSQIAEQVHLISHWEVSWADYSNAPEEEAAWFIDPPYVQGGHFYPGEGINYDHLAHWCKGRLGQTIVCETGGASWLPFVPLYTHKGIRRQTRQELVWTSKT